MPEFYEPGTLKKLQEVELAILKDFVAVCEENHLEYYGIAGTGIGAMRHGGFIPWDDDIDIAMPRKDFEKLKEIVGTKMKDKYYILDALSDSRYPLMTARMAKKGTLFIENAIKEAKCPCGIFLDLYMLDNVADNRLFYELQSWSAWFWGKILILSRMKRPYLAVSGIKAEVIYSACGLVHGLLKLFRISPQWIRSHCEKVCRRYDGKKTRRMAFLPDTSPYWNVIDKTKLYPLKKMEFEGITLTFPGNIHQMLTSMYGDYMQLPPVDKRKTHYPYRLRFTRGEKTAGETKRKQDGIDK